LRYPPFRLVCKMALLRAKIKPPLEVVVTD